MSTIETVLQMPNSEEKTHKTIKKDEDSNNKTLQYSITKPTPF